MNFSQKCEIKNRGEVVVVSLNVGTTYNTREKGNYEHKAQSEYEFDPGTGTENVLTTVSTATTLLNFRELGEKKVGRGYAPCKCCTTCTYEYLNALLDGSST